MAKSNSITTKNAAILLLVGLGIQEILPRAPFIGSMSWAGTVLILIIAILLLLK